MSATIPTGGHGERGLGAGLAGARISRTACMMAVVLVACAGAMALGAFAASAVPLSELYPFYLLLVVAGGAWAAVGLLRSLRAAFRRQSTGKASRWGLRLPSVTVMSLFAVAVALAMTASVSRTQAEWRTAVLNHGEGQFVLLDQGRLPEFDRPALVSELERAWRKTAEQWQPAGHVSIEVFLYSDRQEYLRSSPGVGIGAMQCLQDGPRLYLYLEPRSYGNSSRVNLSTARHEVAHAVMCQALGPQRFHEMPDWVHEGYARSMQYEGLEHLWARGNNRARVWELRHGLMSGDEFCSFETHLPRQEDVSLFYGTAWEFLRYLNAAHARPIVPDIGRLVQGGEDGESAIGAVLGASCPAAYARWQETF